jgi:hypothetical protein
MTVAPGGSVIGFGIVAAPVVNDGSVEAQTDLLEITGDLAGTGTDSIDADTTLQLDGAVTGGQTVTFAGSDGILAVEEPSVFAATISGFAAADLIDLFGITATAVSYQSNILTVMNGATTVASLNLAGNYAGNTDFEVSSDGVGGTRISIGPPPALVGNFWTSASGGDWGTAANWNPATVPDRVATISLPGTYTVTIASNETFNIGTLIVSDTGATLSVAGTLDLTDTLFLKRGTVSIASTGTIAGGTIDVTGGTLTGVGDGSGGLFSAADGVGGTLDGVRLEGALDLSATNAAVRIKDGITLTGKDGNGSAAINLTGLNTSLYVQGAATLDNATINIGANDRIDEAKLYNDDQPSPSVLTLGPSLTVNHVGINAMFGSTRSGSGIVNAGTINAGVNGGNFTFAPIAFTNHGTITISNGDTAYIEPRNFTNSADGTLSITSGGTLWIQNGTDWSNGGSISVNGGTLNLGGPFTLAQLGSVTRTGGALNLFGILDNTGATLSVGTGTTLGTLTLANGLDGQHTSPGTIKAGTIADSGGGLAFFTGSGIGPFSPVQYGGVLDGVTYQGTLDLTPDGSYVAIKDGITLEGGGGFGSAVINLGSTLRGSSKKNEIDVLGNQTLDNAVINVGAGSTSSIIRTDDSVLTLGPNLTVNAAGAGEGVEFTDLPSHTNAADGGSIVNAGTINASLTNTIGVILFDSASFINQGTITVSNNATVAIQARIGWSNIGTINVNGGKLFLGALALIDDPQGLKAIGEHSVTLAQFGTIVHTGGTVEFDGKLDNTGTTLNLGTGTALGTLVLASHEFGGIFNGTIHDAGSGLIFEGAILDGVTYQGTLDLSAGLGPNGRNSLYIKNGITWTGVGGTGNGLINLTGAGSDLYVEGVETLDNATLNIGNAGGDTLHVDEVNDALNDGSGSAPVLTLGANLTITHSGATATLDSGAVDPLTNKQRDSIVNTGTINASLNGGSFIIRPLSFTNQGQITVSNGDTLVIDAPSWSNSGTISENGGTLKLGGSFTLGQLGTLTRTGGTVNLTGTLDNTGTTLNVGAGSALGTLVLSHSDLRRIGSGNTFASYGTVLNGTIHDAGAGLAFSRRR